MTIAAAPPPPGLMSVERYLTSVPRGFEYVAGRLEELPMPKRVHQKLIRTLSRQMEAASGYDNVEIAGFRVRTVGTNHREPDILYTADPDEWSESVAASADLALEIVSDGRSDR